MNVFTFLWKVIVKRDQELWDEFMYHYHIAKKQKANEAKFDFDSRMREGNKMLPKKWPGRKESKYYIGDSDSDDEFAHDHPDAHSV